MSCSYEMKMKEEKPSQTLLSLPYDLLLDCLARVSRLYYPTLSLVSKSFQSLLSSPDLYRFRSLLEITESCLYVCIKYYSSEDRWFTLARKPNRTLTTDTEKSGGYVLVGVPTPLTYPRVLVSVGSSIYNIDKSSSVWIFDCRSHKGQEGPSLGVKLNSFSACALDDKIYVAGCYKDSDSDSDALKNWFEVFDTKTQIWEPKPICSSVEKDPWYQKSASVDGKFHVKVGSNVISYDPKQSKWDVVEGQMGCGMLLSSACAINNVLYFVFVSGANVNDCFAWYDTEGEEWKMLKGLVGLPKFPCNTNFRLADYGGKMAVLWGGSLSSSVGDRKMICCAVIALERHKNREMWGNVEWFDHMLTLNSPYDNFKVLATTL